MSKVATTGNPIIRFQSQVNAAKLPGQTGCERYNANPGSRLEARGRHSPVCGSMASTTSDGRRSDMADQWLFKSETYDNCNCAMNCGCQFNLPSTHGYCQSAFVGNIVEGHFNDTPLSGLNWAALYKWPGEIKDGNGRRQIVIDERADEPQRIALETIISGEACEPLSNLFAVFASTCSEFCETLFLPIDLDADLELRAARVEIPGVMRSAAGRRSTSLPVNHSTLRWRVPVAVSSLPTQKSA